MRARCTRGGWVRALGLDPSPARADDRPTVLPAYRRQKGLAPEVVEIAVIRAHPQRNHPPLAVLGLDQIGMPCAHNGVVAAQVPVGEDRVARVGFIGSCEGIAARNRYGMVVAGTALGDHQVVEAVDSVQVGASA